jgi:hypothetical protein
LLRRRATAPLFDVERYVRNLERGYLQAYDTAARHQPPQHIDVRDVGASPRASAPHDSVKDEL